MPQRGLRRELQLGGTGPPCSSCLITNFRAIKRLEGCFLFSRAPDKIHFDRFFMCGRPLPPTLTYAKDDTMPKSSYCTTDCPRGRFCHRQFSSRQSRSPTVPNDKGCGAMRDRGLCRGGGSRQLAYPSVFCTCKAPSTHLHTPARMHFCNEACPRTRKERETRKQQRPSISTTVVP